MNAAHQQGSEAKGYQLHVAQALLPRRAFENKKAHHEGECAAVSLDMGPAPATPMTYNVTYLMFDAN